MASANKNPQWHAFAFLFLGMAFFGSATPISKLVGEHFSPLLASTIRMWLAGLVLLPFALHARRDFFRLSKAQWWRVFGVAALGNIGFSVLMLYGMQMVSGVAGSIIMSLTPALTAIGSVIFLHESMHWRKIAALLVGLSGVLVIQLGSDGGGSGNSVVLGSALVFAAIYCEAFYTILGKEVTEEVSPLSLATLAALLAGVLFIPFAIYDWPHTDWQAVTTADWAALGWWGLGTMALGSVLWYSGVSKVPGHIAAGFMAVMPLSALLLSYGLLSEPFKWLHVPGFALALGGTGLMAWQHAQKARKQAHSSTS